MRVESLRVASTSTRTTKTDALAARGVGSRPSTPAGMAAYIRQAGRQHRGARRGVRCAHLLLRHLHKVPQPVVAQARACDRRDDTPRGCPADMCAQRGAWHALRLDSTPDLDNTPRTTIRSSSVGRFSCERTGGRDRAGRRRSASRWRVGACGVGCRAPGPRTERGRHASRSCSGVRPGGQRLREAQCV